MNILWASRRQILYRRIYILYDDILFIFSDYVGGVWRACSRARDEKHLKLYLQHGKSNGKHFENRFEISSTRESLEKIEKHKIEVPWELIKFLERTSDPKMSHKKRFTFIALHAKWPQEISVSFSKHSKKSKDQFLISYSANVSRNVFSSQSTTTMGCARIKWKCFG